LKKALVVAIVMVLGLGLFASAQTWEGTWDTDITIDPSTAVFADFLSFDSDLDIGFLVGGWTFGMTSDFSGIGLDGLGFTAVGVLGAFSFSVDMDFVPMKATAVETAYTTLATLTGANSPCLQTPSWTYAAKTVTTTYTPAFDDLTVEGSVSIAGLSFGGLFFLEGTDSGLATEYSNYATDTDFPTQVDEAGGDIPTLQTTLLSVASSVKVGTGAKFTISGSFAGATFTNYTYFNLVEYSYNTLMGAIYKVPTYLADSLKMSGYIAGLECAGCNVMFTRNYTLIEGLAPFGDCLTVDIAIDFSCCDFEGFAILIKDVSLGCCWDLGFDFLVEFDTTSKTMTLEPEMTFASSCFTIVADVVWDAATSTIGGIKFQGLGYSNTFNGVTVSFAATWDYIANPLVGSYGYITHTYADALHFWKPDVKGSSNIPGSAAAINADGIGDWVMVDIACSYDRAYAFNQMSISYEADACCAGALSFDVDTYFGDITHYVLDGVYGSYYFDAGNDGAYAGTDVIEFLGGAYGYAEYILLADTTATTPLATNTVPGISPCDPCATADTIAEASYLVGHYTGTAITSILGWVETDAEVTLGLGSNVAFTLGLDVSWFGWGSLTFGVEFTF